MHGFVDAPRPLFLVGSDGKCCLCSATRIHSRCRHDTTYFLNPEEAPETLRAWLD